MAAPVGFMESPLVLWVQTLGGPEPAAYKDISSGVYLNSVMHQIDPRAVTEGLVKNADDLKDRIINWDILMKNIKAYYRDVLQQFIVMRLPNIVRICKDPESDGAKEELQKVLLLLLGCAVQCEQKEDFIECIRVQLPVQIQQDIVEFIKEITDDTKNVFAIDLPPEQMDEVSKNMHNHLAMLIKERDGYIEEIKDLNNMVDELNTTNHDLQSMQAQRPMVSPASSPDKQEKQQLAVELAETKAKLRKFRQELEDKTEFVLELQEELEELKGTTNKLRTENLELTQDARAARSLRDEIDILKEKVTRVDKYEAEITKYKEKLNELDFFKSRVDELREDNQVLAEARNMLEEKLEASHGRIETIVDIEKELLKYKEQVKDMAQERDLDRLKMQELAEENARLEFDKRSSFNESASLEGELGKMRHRLNSSLNNSLSDQLNETANAKILRLELENQRLQKHIEEIKENQLVENASKLLELEKENHRLSKKVEKLQEATSADSQNYIELEQMKNEIVRERNQLAQTIDTVKESSERQVRELERENEQLQHTVQTLRERSEKTHDLRLKEIEKENKRMHDGNKDLTDKVSQLEYSNRQMQKSYEKLKDKVEQVKVVEEENSHLEHANEDLRKTNATLQLTCDKFERLEQEFCDLEVEKEKLERTVVNLQKVSNKVETLEQDNINLTVENQHFKKQVENVKNYSAQIAELQHSIELKEREISQLKRTVDNKKSDKEKQDHLEMELLELDNENQKLQRSLEGANRRLREIENDVVQLENENEKLVSTIESMRLSMRKLDDLERENKDFDIENQQLQKDKAMVEKENKRIKLHLEEKSAVIDDMTSRLEQVDKANKSLKRVVAQHDDSDERVRELEKDNTEMIQRGNMDRKTLSTLREELVNEKIKTQELNNELEKLSGELERIGLNKEKLTAIEHAHDESKYKALENMMEQAYKRTTEIKEEKIHMLESRLEESKNRNVKLQEDLRSVRREYGAFQQRREEEQTVPSRAVESERGIPRHVMMSANSTKEILELKDQIITVERQNAMLETELKNSQYQTKTLSEQNVSLQQQASRSHAECVSIQAQYNNLQGQWANLQVENKTLQSQNSTLQSQSALQQKQLGALEADLDHTANDFKELHAAHEDLNNKCNALEKLHNQLIAEHEGLLTEHATLKTNFKSTKSEFKTLRDQQGDIVHEKETVLELRQALEKQREMLKSDNQSHGHLQYECMRLTEENLRLAHTKDRTDQDMRDLSHEYKTLKSEYNQLKMKHSELQANYADTKDRLAGLDVELAKLAHRCEALSQLNTKLEEENRTLMMQLQALLNQNQDLLTQSLESKDQRTEEQREYLEKLAELRRQKEKLEDKIMEQYKRYDPVKKKNRGFGAFLRKALGGKSNNKRSKSMIIPQGDAIFGEMTMENSSAGSDETRRSTPNLAMQNKALAKSTTAIHNIKYDTSSTGGSYKLRGAKSTENIADPHHPRSDNDSVSSGSMRDVEWPSRAGKRRTLLDSSSGSNLRHSLSSDDNAPRMPRLVPRSATIGVDESGDEITLAEFLKEVDMSPKSRKRYIKDEERKSQERDKRNRRKSQPDLITEALGPELGPRPPTVTDESMGSPSKGLRSRSEINISTLSSPSTHSFHNDHSSFATFQPELQTSTPKYPRHQAVTPTNSLPPERRLSNHPDERRFSMPREIVSTPNTPRLDNSQYNSSHNASSRYNNSYGQRINGDSRYSDGRSTSSGQSTPDNNQNIPPPGYRPTTPRSSNYNSSPVKNTNNEMYNNNNYQTDYDRKNNDSNSRDNFGSRQNDISRDNFGPGSRQNEGGPRDSFGPVSRQNSGSSIGSGYNSTSGSGYNNNTNSYNGPNNNIGGSNIGGYNAMTRRSTSHVSVPMRPQSATINGSQPQRPLSAGINSSSSFSISRHNSDVTKRDNQRSSIAGDRVDVPPPRSDVAPPRPMTAVTSDRLDAHHRYNSHHEPRDAPRGPMRANHDIDPEYSTHSPSNVRHVLQSNVKVSVQQQQMSNPSYQSGPLPPPRRTRPMSAGPLRSSSSSAFSVPQRSTTPNPPVPERNTGRTLPQRPDEGSGRQLPSRPDERPNSGPGNTPPRPATQGGEGQQKKNHIWYEYGCV